MISDIQEEGVKSYCVSKDNILTITRFTQDIIEIELPEGFVIASIDDNFVNDVNKKYLDNGYVII